MWKAPLALAIGFYVSVAGLCADFWQVKAPGDWNDKEVAKILNGSPWASRVQQSKRETETKNETGAGERTQRLRPSKTR